MSRLWTPAAKRLLTAGGGGGGSYPEILSYTTVIEPNQVAFNVGMPADVEVGDLLMLVVVGRCGTGNTTISGSGFTEVFEGKPSSYGVSTPRVEVGTKVADGTETTVTVTPSYRRHVAWMLRFPSGYTFGAGKHAGWSTSLSVTMDAEVPAGSLLLAIVGDEDAYSVGWNWPDGFTEHSDLNSTSSSPTHAGIATMGWDGGTPTSIGPVTGFNDTNSGFSLVSIVAA